MNPKMNPNDEHIWGSIQRKDGPAFENFYKEHYKLFFLTACGYLKDARLAQEVVNDVFVKIWQEAETINIQTSLKSYIYRSVINRCLNELDKGKRDKQHLSELAHRPEPYVEPQNMEDTELKARLYRAIDELPEQCRKVFMMSRFDGLKQQEIANLLGISIKTVKNHITHALKLLHKVLRDWHSLPLWIGVIKYFFRS
ncbi:MAG: RNA polymerase sigma-70 factor [Sphingobacteriales bacterium]|nr:RNA polymerase sigma-70 factor [Sphingobacteriales bacterium]